MTIKQLHYFLAVAEARSFTRAAQNYFIAQTAMSQQIGALEKELGFRLFHRTNRIVELTDAGQVLFQRLRPLVLDLESAIQSASAAAGVQHHILRIGLHDQHPNRFLTATLSAFARQMPDVTPILVPDTPPALMEGVVEGGLDCALLGKRVFSDRSALTATELFRFPVLDYVLAVPADHPLAQEQSLSWSALQGLDLIAYSPLKEGQDGQQLRQLLASHKVTANILCTTRSVDAALLYVESGLGLCLLPAYTSNQATPEIRTLPMKYHQHDTMLLLRHKDADNPILNEFITVCRRETRTLLPPKLPEGNAPLIVTE